MPTIELQKNTIAYFLQNPTALSTIGTRLNPNNYFTNPASYFMYQVLQESYNNHQTLPTLSEMQIIVPMIMVQESPLLRNEYLMTISEIYGMEITHVTRDMIIEEVVNNKLLELSAHTVDLTIPFEDRLEYLREQAESINTLQGTQGLTLGFDPFSRTTILNRLELYDEMYGGEVTPTGFPYLDQNLRDGGLRPGDFVVLMGYTGGGKTTAAINLALNFIRRGKRVVYYIFDNQVAELVERIDACITQVALNEPKEMNQFVRILQNSCTEFGENLLFLVPMLPYETSLPMIRAHMDMVEELVGPIDVAFFDSGDHAKTSVSYKDKRNELERLFAEIRGIAWSRNIICIATTQGNRQALSADTITLEHISEAYSKAWSASLFITICMTAEERVGNRCRFVIIKNTKGPTNIVCPMLLDLPRMSVVCDPRNQPVYFTGNVRSSRGRSETTSSLPVVNNLPPQPIASAPVFAYMEV